MSQLPHNSSKPTLRSDTWLMERLNHIWQEFYPDIARSNAVDIVFGRKSRTRLGSIGMQGWVGIKGVAYKTHDSIPHGTTVITITGYFRDTSIPDYVIDATIGHEMVHYAHGFHSPHPQLYRYPHQGGIVDTEMRKRGMGDILRSQRLWLKNHWHHVAKPVSRIRKRSTHGKLRFLRSLITR